MKLQDWSVYYGKVDNQQITMISISYSSPRRTDLTINL